MSKVRPIPSETAPEGEQPLYRIGELARRAGIPAATLRAWERRYGVVSPARGESGYRLYSRGDELVLRRMLDLVQGGLAPAEAARRVLSEPGDEGGSPSTGAIPISGLREALSTALAEFDDRRADQVLDRAVTVLSTESLLEEVLLPVLRDLQSDSIGQEHFASNLVRGRLLALARGWGGGTGRRALLACPGGELHDLGLIAFGLALRDRGWRIAFLGADTPIDALRAAAEATNPDLIVLCSMTPDLYDGWDSDLKRLSRNASLMLGGPGATDDLCARLNAVHLARGPVAEASALSI